MSQDLIPNLTPRPPSRPGKGEWGRPAILGQRVERVKAERAKELRRTMTPAETALWARLRRNGLGGLHFRRQQVITGFIVDFYCHEISLAVELDGGVHARKKEYDAERDVLLQARGIHVLRLDNAEVMQNTDRVLDRIRLYAAQQRTVPRKLVPDQDTAQNTVDAGRPAGPVSQLARPVSPSRPGKGLGG